MSSDLLESQRHQARMDRKYRYVRHVFDLTRKYFLFGRERAIAALHLEQVDSALEIGCGTGRNLRIMGRLNPRVQLIGLDISTEMLKSARASIDRAGMADRTTLVHGDATHLPDGLATPRMLMSYSLSMVPNWRCALASAIDRLQSGGILSIVDFGDFNGFPLWLARHCIETLSLHDAPPCIELSHELERHASSGHIALTHGYAMAGFYQFATVTKLTDQPPHPANHERLTSIHGFWDAWKRAYTTASNSDSRSGDERLWQYDPAAMLRAVTIAVVTLALSCVAADLTGQVTGIDGRTMSAQVTYYNNAGTRVSLGKDAPPHRIVRGRIIAEPWSVAYITRQSSYR